ncbi:MAG TPA: class I SAM-dependent methyltransferase [Phycisphaerae bacterium]|nr:class I SAM-dependent methyltransferase [Phycisphaerae bacterium]
MSSVWDLRARLYDVCEGSTLRRGPAKSTLFRDMEGRILFVAVGTGVDIAQFPPGRRIVAVDISNEMLRRAERRQKRYNGDLKLVEADAMDLTFLDASFDMAVTSCTFCSVPDPVRALRELYRVLRPGGKLLMIEHVRSRNTIFGLTLDLMTLWTRRLGTEMNRDTVSNVLKAGFEITSIDSVYLDIILAIRGRKPRSAISSVEECHE